jgi:hypothetical protein
VACSATKPTINMSNSHQLCFGDLSRSSQRCSSTLPKLLRDGTECPDLMQAFYDCLEANDDQSSAGTLHKDEMEGWGLKHFKTINAISTPYDYTKGLPK